MLGHRWWKPVNTVVFDPVTNDKLNYQVCIRCGEEQVDGKPKTTGIVVAEEKTWKLLAKRDPKILHLRA
jgi:hypothetical protein